MSKAILSVLGQDQPGIVATVSRILFEKNCNIENVSQTILQSEFAGIFVVSIPEDYSLEVLHENLEVGLSPFDLHVHIESLEEREESPLVQKAEPFVITTKGPDRRGLVAGISEVIARYGVNITNLQAVFKGGEEPGNNIMIYEVDVPPGIDQQAFYTDLRKRASELLLDIDMQHRRIFETIHRI